jgi:hypothetical protein
MGAAVAQPRSTAPAAPQQRDTDERIASLLGDIRDALKKGQPNCNVSDCPEVERIRSEQRAFLKTRNKFPDYLEVGADVWDRVCDWHIEHAVPLQVTRMADGRYALPFFQTLVVLRSDFTNAYVGQGFDK